MMYSFTDNSLTINKNLLYAYELIFDISTSSSVLSKQKRNRMADSFCILSIFHANYSFGTNVNTNVLFGDMGTLSDGNFVL
jgi:hypothetical protein